MESEPPKSPDGGVQRRKGGTLKKLKKTQSDRADSSSLNKANIVSMSDLFGKQTGSFSSPVIDMGASFTSVSSGGTGGFEDFHFGADNPIFVPVDEDGQEILEEDEPRLQPKLRAKRWTLTSLFTRRSSEKL